MTTDAIVKEIQKQVGGSIRNGGTVSTNTIIDLIIDFEEEGYSDEGLVRAVVQEILSSK